MARRATLKDVAAAAGVSVTTVSLVLNDRPARVSTEKREAIARAVKQLNYVPNQNARSLVTKQSKLVALIVPDIETCSSRRSPNAWRMSVRRRGIR